MVNCTPDFGTQPRVINGFSDLMVEVFGENGRRPAVPSAWALAREHSGRGRGDRPGRRLIFPPTTSPGKRSLEGDASSAPPGPRPWHDRMW
ncbi:MAG: hypothetical protein Ct9H300mP1_39600 [Planctomycetaceae bacterium]|nr:MAG: hypothetical protein Ct9H300mP1_39600 [Planctomycetaceae bacterium]